MPPDYFLEGEGWILWTPHHAVLEEEYRFNTHDLGIPQSAGDDKNGF